MDSWAQPMVNNWLHELKSCYALNLSDIAIKSVYAWPLPPQEDGRNKFFASGGLYYGEAWWSKKLVLLF